MFEDAPLQLAQLAAGLEPQLLAQPHAHTGVYLECLCLPPAAVQGEHCLRLQTLAQRVGGGEVLQLG